MIDKHFAHEGFGGYSLFMSSNSSLSSLEDHETHHLWQSRSSGDTFAAEYSMAALLGLTYRKMWKSTDVGGNPLRPTILNTRYNYYETIAERYNFTWW